MLQALESLGLQADFQAFSAGACPGCSLQRAQKVRFRFAIFDLRFARCRQLNRKSKIQDRKWLGCLGRLVLGICLCVGSCAASGEGLSGSGEEYLREQLKRKVSFDLVDAPLGETAAFLSELCKVNVLLDPRLTGPGAPRVTLHVQGETAEQALTLILRQAALDYKARDEALFIHPQGLYAETPALVLTTAQQETIRKALAELGAEEFDLRIRASKVLAEMGAAAVPALQEALAKSADPEVRVRLKELLGKFPTSAFFEELPEVTKALDALGRRVSLELADNSLEETLVPFLSELARLQANTTLRLTAAADAKKLRVTLRMRSMKLGNALRWIARLAGAWIVLKDGGLLFEKRQ